MSEPVPRPVPRMEVFKRLPLVAQRIFIESSRNSPALAADTAYIAGLEAAHRECVQQATPEEQDRYYRKTGEM